MSTMVEGILLPAGEDAEPFPVPVHDHKDIQGFVGGHFDVVSRQCENPDNPDEQALVVGYVHDEGLLLGLPLNKLASVVFQREIRGAVVLVGGLNESGVHDGDNHELPGWFSSAVFTTLVDAVNEVNDEAENLKLAILRSIREGLLTKEQAEEIIHGMYLATATDDPEAGAVLGALVQSLVEFHQLRTVGILPRPNERIRSVISGAIGAYLGGDPAQAHDALVALADELEREADGGNEE